ncbi:MAG: PIN domain-containing protein [Acidimicrobiales bacterium]
MIILDTNVLSELTRERPDPHVVAWLDAADPDDLATTSVTVAEILFGVALLPDGRRKSALEASMKQILGDEFGDRIEPFDELAARSYAGPAAVNRRAGRTVAFADAQIAAICASLGAALATRNLSDFAGFDIALVDPWDGP